ncbi:tRNA lysidine(34) synthetase TilS [Ferrovibrio sp.]|uniref:tRNA lysidine(34) synthetase TilS n=1 Tax=Ferrovibrio sp. TaxID=1917215 RepID=UPI0025B8A03A|nr:tRNA lysidine(34) synthetase TilS [Ferrovibrio sp.]
MTTGAAVTVAEFDRCLRPLLADDKPKSIAVAVSGGADSMALVLLTADWARKKRIAVLPLIVDHRLRAESTKEARHVAGLLRRAGLTPKILTWDAKQKPSANRQAAAREARYALLSDACAKAGIRHLLLAHHRDDQAETVLLRALRGSGVDGLAAMQPRATRDGLILLRPLLDLPKVRLVATLKKRKQAWVEDPSNASLSFQRVRVRAALDLLSENDAAVRAELVQHLAQTAKNFARTRALLDAAAYDLLHASVQLTPAGTAWLDPAALIAAEDDLALRALVKLLGAIGGLPVPPRLDGLQRLLDALRGGKSLPLTLHRCLLSRVRGETHLLICREARYLPEPAPLTSMLWDGRFRIAATKPVRGVSIAPLGKDRLSKDVALTAALLPKVAWPALPALRTAAGRLLAVPGLNWGEMPAGVTISFQPALPAA